MYKQITNKVRVTIYVRKTDFAYIMEKLKTIRDIISNGESLVDYSWRAKDITWDFNKLHYESVELSLDYDLFNAFQNSYNLNKK